MAGTPLCDAVKTGLGNGKITSESAAKRTLHGSTPPATDRGHLRRAGRRSSPRHTPRVLTVIARRSYTAQVLTIRPTTAEDLIDIVAIEAATDTSVWLGETGLSWHEGALTDPDQEHLVTDSGSALTSFVVLAGIRDTAGAIELRRMVVHPSSRGAGHGRALLKAAISRAYDYHHARRLWLDVKARNRRAKTLYESEGFRTVETLTGAVTEVGGSTSDLLVMVHQPR
jgi:diamine N-acetyltransferase